MKNYNMKKIVRMQGVSRLLDENLQYEKNCPNERENDVPRIVMTEG